MVEKIVVLGCYEVEDFECEEPWACISITTEDDWPEINEENRVDILQMSFGDICASLPGYVLFSHSHAYDIIDFVEEVWDEITTLLIHCEMGRSRSAAVAAAISKAKKIDDSQWFDFPYVPNGWVHSTLLEAFAARGYSM